MSYNPFGRAGPSRPPPKNPRPPANGVQRQTAAQLKEHSALFTTYEHLPNQERADAALLMLRKVASIVKPIMQKHHWHVQVLAEFLPKEQSLLGLNINKGYKICIRLRYHHNPGLFLPIEEVTDTMLHELSHNVWGEWQIFPSTSVLLLNLHTQAHRGSGRVVQFEWDHGGMPGSSR